VAYAIKEIVDRFDASNPLEYVVIVGDDDVIPFFRHADNALLANERNYVPPVKDSTASQASLRLGYVLSQDRYGARAEVSFKSATLPLPGLAVGRLVETPEEITNMLNAYLSTAGGVLPEPASVLVTGYDFLEDAALAIKTELETGTGLTADSLITPRDVSPADPSAWTADQLRTQLLGSRHDLIFLAGHFSAGSALAADYTTRLLAEELASSPVDLINALVYSIGCHAGYNIVDGHAVPNVSAEPDWAQAFAGKGATLIAGTGYQYGDTDFIEYSERLYLEFTKQLRSDLYAAVPVGKALAAFLPEEESEALFQSAGLARFTPRTIVSLPRLRLEFKRIRESGAAIDSEENTPGVRCVAAPIFGSNGRAVAAMSLTGPVQQVTEERVAKIVEKLREAARQLTLALGGHPPDIKAN